MKTAHLLHRDIVKCAGGACIALSVLCCIVCVPATHALAASENVPAASSCDTAADSPFDRIWHYPIYRDDNKHYMLEVRTVCVAVLILLCGMLASKRIARWVGRTLAGRTNLEENAAASMERVLYYALLVVVALFALQAIDVPLTAFALFGGALAIGIGFGAQNLINNFISGLILMIERPIRVSDVVEIDGEQGSVVSIGARCSHVRLFTGVDVLVPNSTFLEKKVVNWTLSGRRHRHSIKVSLQQASSAREAERVLMQLVTEHPDVLADPAPVVVFSDFAGNASIFEVFFWIEMGPGKDSRVVCSDLRFRIDELFRESGILKTP